MTARVVTDITYLALAAVLLLTAILALTLPYYASYICGFSFAFCCMVAVIMEFQKKAPVR